jgi:hypothetical protein
VSEQPKDLHAAERALEAVAAIRQVVQAVWTLARAQQPQVEAAAGEASAYLGWVEELVARFGGDSAKEAPGSALWVVVGPERPFCGGLARHLLERVPPEGSLLLVGRRLADAVPAVGPLLVRIVSSLPAAAGPEDIDPCARRVAAALLELDHAGPVGMLHPAEGGSELLRAPLLAAGPRHTHLAPETYSTPETVLAAAIHEALSGRLVVGLAEGLRTEVRARLVAADAARQGCDHALETLRQQWRVLRQEAITGELLELFSGRLAELG